MARHREKTTCKPFISSRSPSSSATVPAPRYEDDGVIRLGSEDDSRMREHDPSSRGAMLSLLIVCSEWCNGLPFKSGLEFGLDWMPVAVTNRA